MTPETLVLALRGAAAVGVLVLLAGGIPRIVGAGLAAVVGVWSALLAGVSVGSEALLIVAARELVIGATIGIVAALPILAAGMAGQLVDIGAGQARGGAYKGLFAILAAAVFVGIDGHVTVMTSIVESFRDVPVTSELRVLDAIGGLVGSAVKLAVPWLVTAAVVEIGVGVGMRIAGRAGHAAPIGAAVPAALVMMTAALVGTFAVAFAALVRGG